MDWFSLFLVAVLFVIVYVQALHGLLSAAIMCALVLLCCALAFATYEWVAMSYLIGPLGDLAMSTALVGTFIIPLIVSRVLLDKRLNPCIDVDFVNVPLLFSKLILSTLGCSSHLRVP